MRKKLSSHPGNFILKKISRQHIVRYNNFQPPKNQGLSFLISKI